MLRYKLDKLPEYLLNLEQGATRESVAPILGLTSDRLNRLLMRGREEVKQWGPRVDSDEFVERDEGECGRLFLYTIRAEARAELALARVLYSSSLQSWRAAQSLLERRFPHRWAKIKRTEASALLDPTEKKPPGLDDRTANDLRSKVLGIKKPKGET